MQEIEKVIFINFNAVGFFKRNCFLISKRINRKFFCSACQSILQCAMEHFRITSCNKQRTFIADSDRCYRFFKIFNMLYLIDEDIVLFRIFCQRIQSFFQIFPGFDSFPTFSFQVQNNNMIIINTFVFDFINDLFHQNGFTATPDTSYDFDIL